LASLPNAMLPVESDNLVPLPLVFDVVLCPRLAISLADFQWLYILHEKR
jgi:hypothetical protein